MCSGPCPCAHARGLFRLLPQGVERLSLSPLLGLLRLFPLRLFPLLRLRWVWGGWHGLPADDRRSTCFSPAAPLSALGQAGEQRAVLQGPEGQRLDQGAEELGQPRPRPGGPRTGPARTQGARRHPRPYRHAQGQRSDGARRGRLGPRRHRPERRQAADGGTEKVRQAGPHGRRPGAGGPRRPARDAVPALRDLLEDKDIRIRAHAAQALCASPATPSPCCRSSWKR